MEESPDLKSNYDNISPSNTHHHHTLSSSFKQKTSHKSAARQRHSSEGNLDKKFSLNNNNNFSSGLTTITDELFIQRPSWIPDELVTSCFLCSNQFTLLIRKHHCRACGEIVCNICSLHRVAFPKLGYYWRVRICDSCFVKYILHRRGFNIEFLRQELLTVLQRNTQPSQDDIMEYSSRMELKEHANNKWNEIDEIETQLYDMTSSSSGKIHLGGSSSNTDTDIENMQSTINKKISDLAILRKELDSLRLSTHLVVAIREVVLSDDFTPSLRSAILASPRLILISPTRDLIAISSVLPHAADFIISHKSSSIISFHPSPASPSLHSLSSTPPQNLEVLLLLRDLHFQYINHICNIERIDPFQIKMNININKDNNMNSSSSPMRTNNNNMIKTYYGFIITFSNTHIMKRYIIHSSNLNPNSSYHHEKSSSLILEEEEEEENELLLRNEVVSFFRVLSNRHSSRIREQFNIINKLRNMMNTSVDWSNIKHESMLHNVWKAFTGEKENIQQKDNKWKEIGFQGMNPITDFRGTGSLGLYCLYYFGITYPDIIRKIVDNQKTNNIYPLCATGINVVAIISELIGLRQAIGVVTSNNNIKNNNNNKKKKINESIIESSFLFKLFSRTGGTILFEEMFCLALRLINYYSNFNNIKQEINCMNFGIVFDHVRNKLNTMLSRHPLHFETLRSWILEIIEDKN